MRKKFRYSRELDCMVEITDERDDLHFVRDDIEPIPSPLGDGTMISSRSKLREVMQQNGLVFMDETGKTNDRYAEQRQRQEFRERSWEWLSRPGVTREDKRPYRKLKN